MFSSAAAVTCWQTIEIIYCFAVAVNATFHDFYDWEVGYLGSFLWNVQVSFKMQIALLWNRCVQPSSVPCPVIRHQKLKTVNQKLKKLLKTSKPTKKILVLDLFIHINCMLFFLIVYSCLSCTVSNSGNSNKNSETIPPPPPPLPN